MMKICVDCHYYSELNNCHRKGVKKFTGNSPVNGKSTWSYKLPESALSERKSILPWNCGKNARYFRAKKGNK